MEVVDVYNFGNTIEQGYDPDAIVHGVYSVQHLWAETPSVDLNNTISHCFIYSKLSGN